MNVDWVFVRALVWGPSWAASLLGSIRGGTRDCLPRPGPFTRVGKTRAVESSDYDTGPGVVHSSLGPPPGWDGGLPSAPRPFGVR